MADQSLPRSAAGDSSPWLIAAIVSIATFMEVLDTSIANVSLRHIAGALGAGQDESTWVLTSYLVSNAIVLPISGWLSNVIGRKRFYMGCVALFTISSLLCGLSSNLTMLIAMRVLQGVGGGGLAPTEQSLLADTFKPAQRGSAFAIYGLTVVFAPSIGPLIGGYITDNLDWRWIFFINVPVGILSLTLVQIFVVDAPRVKADRKKLLKSGFSIDYIGFALVALGLGALQIILDRGQREDWFESNYIIALTTVCVLCLGALVVYELLHEHPIVDLKLFGNRSFAGANIVMFFVGFVLFGTTQLMPQFVQEVLHYDAQTAGYTLTFGGFLTMILMPVTGVLSSKVKPSILIGLGLVFTAAGLFLLTGVDAETDFWTLARGRALQVTGLPFLFVPISTVAYVGIAEDKRNEASALTNLARNLGGSFGIALATTALEQREQLHHVRLAEQITPYALPYRERLEQMTTMFGGGVDAQRRAIGNIANSVQTQSTVFSYLDVFWLMGVVVVLLLPIVLLLRNPPPGEAASGH